MFSAFADEVTTTTTSSSFSFHLNLGTVIAVILILLAVYDIAVGIITIVRKKPNIRGDKSFDKYTEESVAAQSPKLGLFYILLGLGIGSWQVLELLGKKGWAVYLPLIVLVGLAIVIYVIACKKLVKKEA